MVYNLRQFGRLSTYPVFLARFSFQLRLRQRLVFIPFIVDCFFYMFLLGVVDVGEEEEEEGNLRSGI